MRKWIGREKNKQVKTLTFYDLIGRVKNKGVVVMEDMEGK